MINPWNERYAQKDYVYGKEPNVFFKEKLAALKPGNLLLPAEGEGRNAVYAARIGWQVTAFDSSIEAQKKALRLAKEFQISINYLEESYDTIAFEENSFELIALIYAHHPKRQEAHQKLLSYLKPGGLVILEGFSKKQIENNSGGPKSLDLLFSKEELASDFASLSEISIWEEELNREEGEFHLGKASVIRLIGKK